MLDENLDPILIEINHAPSFGTDSDLDLNLKHDLITDTFRMLDMSLKRRFKYKKEHNKVAQNRIMRVRKESFTYDERERRHKINNIAKHQFETKNLGNYGLLYPIVDEKFNLVYDLNKDYYLSPRKSESNLDLKKHNSVDSTTTESKNGAEQLPKSQNLTEKQKTAKRYQQFIDNANDEYEDFTSGFRFRPKNLMLPEDHPTHESSNNQANSRNPIKSKVQMQSTVRNSSKSGFGTSSRRIVGQGKVFPFLLIYRSKARV